MHNDYANNMGPRQQTWILDLVRMIRIFACRTARGASVEPAPPLQPLGVAPPERMACI
jgi:hypothetical protein